MVGSTRVSTSPQALFVSYTSLLGGAERILLDDATALTGRAALACPEGPLAVAAREAGIEVVTLRRRRMELRASARDRLAMPLRMGAQSREVRRIVAQLRPSCVIGWSMRGLLSSAGALRGLKPPRPLVFGHNDLLPSPLVGRAVRAAAKRADLVVALSRAIAEDLEEPGSLGTRVEVVRPGVDLDRFAPSSPPPADPPTALVLGAIVDWKRPDLALEIGARAARELPGLRLRIAGAPIGEGGERLLAQLRQRAAEPDLDGRVELLGQVSDVPGALAAATCLLHCSDREPYGMALVEALARGRPVVAPASAGPLEIVDAGSGVLYPPGDAEAGAAALVDAVRRAAELGGGARARARERFDRTAARARFRALIDEIAPVE
jgi:glycosyltransferase involved in cell wall biosynthesis